MTRRPLQIIIGCLLIFSLEAFAQSPSIKLMGPDQLMLNDLALSPSTKVADIQKVLGVPTQVVNNSGQKGYRYDKLGVVFFVVEDALAGIGLNFNWDGDRHYPEQTFTGSLMAGEKSITKDSTPDDVKAIKVMEFVCPMALLCASKDRTAPVQATVAFKDSKLTQVVFVLE